MVGAGLGNTGGIVGVAGTGLAGTTVGIGCFSPKGSKTKRTIRTAMPMQTEARTHPTHLPSLKVMLLRIYLLLCPTYEKHQKLLLQGFSIESRINLSFIDSPIFGGSFTYMHCVDRRMEMQCARMKP
jgi:hypothetical protein